MHPCYILIVAIVTASASSAFAFSVKWNPIRDVERTVRKAAVAPVGSLVKDADMASMAVVAARAKAVAAEKLTELERRQRDAETAVLEEERKIRVRVEERAVVALEGELKQRKSVPYKIDRIAYTAISNVLFGRDLEVEPMVYENYVFLTVEPKRIASDGDSEVQLRLVIFWKRNDDRLVLRYVALEKRLRSAEPRPTIDPQINNLATMYVDDLAKELQRRGEQ